MKKLVVLTGAGISAESGIKTFRETGGLWEEYNIEDVATPNAWKKNPKLVLEFYNQRRKQLLEVEPNVAHRTLAELQEYFDVQIITQNVDNLHERAGSKQVLHLHGELTKVRSVQDDSLIYDIGGKEIKLGDQCERGFQLRPHIVWFSEMVPELENAAVLSQMADIFLVVGTSLNVHPAAGLINYAPENSPKFLVDPNDNLGESFSGVRFIKERAGEALPKLKQELITCYRE